VKFLFPFSGSYAAVIHVILKSARVSISKGLENMVHEVLHTSRGICWTKAHHPWGIEPSGCFKSYKVLHFVTVLNVPIAVAEIKFTKEYHSTHSLDNGVNSREGEDVFDHDSIDFLIIEYRVVTPVLLPDIENRCRVWGFQFSNKTSVFLLLNVLFLEFFLSTGQRVDSVGNRRKGIRNEGYNVIPWSVWQ
jgi:hypothetical protein